MIFRLTQELAKKIGIKCSRCLAPGRNHFADWCSHLFRDQGVQYIIMTNTASLYSMVMYGRGITDENRFVQYALNYMSEFMTRDGNEFLFRRLIVPETGKIWFSKTGNPRVMGSMRDLVMQAKYYLAVGELSPFDVSLRLNETPMSYIGYGIPKEAFKSLKIEEESGRSMESNEK